MILTCIPGGMFLENCYIVGDEETNEGILIDPGEQIEEILEEVANKTPGMGDPSGSSSVVSFEYGINNAIPHSKGGELLCPGNNISEGFVRLTHILDGDGVDDDGISFIGLNNGNGRGSMDAFWLQNTETLIGPPPICDDGLIIGDVEDDE